ncbi:MAG TPA: enolase C-terminal domain-like protein [Alphaproteobacteria bacterium]|nr:enolase C-terminal domain-like protein [Alphaproteobacteria bacterium]
MTTPAKIVAVDAIPINVAGPRPFRISEGQAATHTSVLLRLLTDRDGVEGNAEIVCAPPGKPEEFPEEILGAIDRYVAPALVGVNATNRRETTAKLERVLKGRIWTKAAVNVALHDLQAKLLGVSVSALLGGRVTPEVSVIGPVIGIAPPDDMAAIAAEEAKAGFAAIKIKIGDTIESDVARIAAVREAIGPRIRLRVDANDHYRPADAIRVARAIERYDIEHLEQPVARGDLLGMAEVRRSVGIPVMTDDAVATPQDAMTVARLGAADRVKVKVTKHGLDGAQLIIGLLEASGIACVLGHVFEMGLAGLAEAHLAAVARNLVPPHEIGSMQPMGTTADIVANLNRPRPASIRLPDGPGLGAVLDWEAIDAMRTDGRRHKGAA